MAGDESSIKELVVDHQFLNDLQKFNNGDINVSIGDLFPSLKQLTFTTTQTVSPGDVERLAHSSLAVLSIEHGEEEGQLVPLIGEPASLGQLFSSSFPQLACLTFRELVMGNIRSEAILRNLKNHLHLKSISIISCFTDEELEPLAEQITTENRMKITLQHDTAQESIKFGDQIRSTFGPLTVDIVDALCHRTCVRCLEVFQMGGNIASDECFPDLHGREVDSKIHNLEITLLRLDDNQSASCCLGKFVSLLSHLTHLEINSCSLHDDFYKEIADRASSSQIQTVNLDFGWILYTSNEKLSHSAFNQLAKFLYSLPCLTNLVIADVTKYLRDDFLTELDSLATSSQWTCQNPYFREKKLMKVVQEWSKNKHRRWELPMTSTHQQPYLPHHVHLLESARPSGQFQSDPHRGIQSEPEQVPEFPREGTHHSYQSSGEASRHLVGQGSGYSSGGHTGLTSFPLSSRPSNIDMPSTSGSRSTQCRRGAAPVESKQIPEHRKRIHSDHDDDNGDRVDESLEPRPRKQGPKTDRKPTSP